MAEIEVLEIQVRSSTTGREVRAQCAPQLEEVVTGLLEEFERHASEWRDGYAIQAGWGPLILREEGEGFVVEAPDYAADPRTQLTDDLTLAVWMTVALLTAPHEAGVEPVEIQWDDDVICAIGWEKHDRLQMSRIDATTPKDSGWFIDALPAIKDGEYSPDEMVRLPAWRVLQLRRPAARAMALPSTVQVVIAGDSIQTVFRASDGAVLSKGPL